MNPNNQFFDVNSVRYQLVKSNPGTVIYNWLFLPGGAGADSSYFVNLIENLTVPGNFWLIDLPANGSNISAQAPADYDFDKWDAYFISAIEKFENPILVGHSFGGMFPLLFPQLETLLKGFIILNSAPTLWLEESDKLAKQKGIPSIDEPMAEFGNNPNADTFKTLLLACAPFYFPPASLAQGTELLNKITFNHYAAMWWFQRAHMTNFNAKWVPEKVKTLIVGATEDIITPLSLFENDVRFKRDNITIHSIQDAGHFPCTERMQAVVDEFTFFETMLK